MSERAAEFRTFPRSWGAEFTRTGEVRFRIWAPGQDELCLRLHGTDSPMSRDEAGWFELLATGVAPGDEYSFVLADGRAVADPASRAQAGDVHGPSLVVDPTAYAWRNAWHGRPWEEAVIYEFHVGSFTGEGTFRAAAERLGALAELGITAVEIMPVAQFDGGRGWGYDGVLLYAPHPAYGSPDDMKAFIDAAHGHGLMVLLDVVYNHFGPEGNYLPLLAPDFFHPERHTPWGGAIAYEKEPVRRFFVENALYWLEEYNLDGLRFDAIDHIEDEDSGTHILNEIAARVRSEFSDRKIHLTTEDSRNITHLHEREPNGRAALYTAEWNDDFHNVVHAIATGEDDGYYADFAEDRWAKLARALAEGFVYQGEHSVHAGKPRGDPSAHLPPTAFIDFLQNHDQIGNRGLGERLLTLADPELVKALTAILLLSPHIPLIFMGEEWGETRPFFFFTDFHGELAEAVRNGRRKEFAKFKAFQEGHSVNEIPDPNEAGTFDASKPAWQEGDNEWRTLYRRLLDLRRRHVVPLLGRAGGDAGKILLAKEGAVAVDWAFSGSRLQLRANLSGEEKQVPPTDGEAIFGKACDGRLAGRSVLVAISRESGR